MCSVFVWAIHFLTLNPNCEIEGELILYLLEIKLPNYLLLARYIGINPTLKVGLF